MSERRAMPGECPAPCKTPEDCVEEGGCLLGYAVESLLTAQPEMVPRSEAEARAEERECLRADGESLAEAIEMLFENPMADTNEERTRKHREALALAREFRSRWSKETP